MDKSFEAVILRAAIKQGGPAGKRVWHFRYNKGSSGRNFPGNSIKSSCL